MKETRRTRQSREDDETLMVEAMSEALSEMPNPPHPGQARYNQFVQQFQQQWHNNRTGGRKRKETYIGILAKDKLRQLVQHIDPEQRMDGDVEDLLLDIANDFVENVTEQGAKLAQVRGSQSLEAQDATLYLEQFYDIRIPGFGSQVPDLKKKNKVLALHESRLNAVRNAIKKNSTMRMKRRRK